MVSSELLLLVSLATATYIDAAHNTNEYDTTKLNFQDLTKKIIFLTF